MSFKLLTKTIVANNLVKIAILSSKSHDCWQETLSHPPLHRDFHSMFSLRTRDPREKVHQNLMLWSFCSLRLKIAYHHFCHMLLVPQTSVVQYGKSWKRRAHWRPSWRPPYLLTWGVSLYKSLIFLGFQSLIYK